MILLMDVGNSRIKWTTCAGAAWTEGRAFAWSLQELESQFESGLANIAGVHSAWISNVAGTEVEQALRKFLGRQIADDHIHFVRSQPRLGGITNQYDDPSRLGVDRLVAMIAAFQRVQAPVCVVDCGTALTVDLVDGAGAFYGGIIAPGPQLMRRSLATGTRQLPAIDIRPGEALALSTESAMAAGCLRAAAGAIVLAYSEFSRRTDGALRCLVTGGDAPLVLPLLAIAYDHDPDLILKGLALLADERS